MIVKSTNYKASNVKKSEVSLNSFSSNIQEMVNEEDGVSHTFRETGTYNSAEFGVTFDFECIFEISGSLVNDESKKELHKSKLSNIVRSQCEIFAEAITSWD